MVSRRGLARVTYSDFIKTNHRVGLWLCVWGLLISAVTRNCVVFGMTQGDDGTWNGFSLLLASHARREARRRAGIVSRNGGWAPQRWDGRRGCGVVPIRWNGNNGTA